MRGSTSPKSPKTGKKGRKEGSLQPGSAWLAPAPTGSTAAPSAGRGCRRRSAAGSGSQPVAGATARSSGSPRAPPGRCRAFLASDLRCLGKQTARELAPKYFLNSACYEENFILLPPRRKEGALAERAKEICATTQGAGFAALLSAGAGRQRQHCSPAATSASWPGEWGSTHVPMGFL